MAELDVVKIEVPGGLLAITGPAVYDLIEAELPDALQPLLVTLAANAPAHTGRMRAAGFQAVVTRRSSGLVQGVDVRIGSPEPYAHLPAFGHRIVARGPSRTGRRLGRERRRQLRAALEARRSSAGGGFVPPNPWVTDSWTRHGPGVTLQLERALATKFGGPS